MNIEELQKDLEELRRSAESFFSSSIKVCPEEDSNPFDQHFHRESNEYWDKLPKEIKDLSQNTQERSLNIISVMIPLLEASPILDTADERDVAECIKRMRSALLLRKYHSWEIEVLHDEGQVLGVNPPGQSDTDPLHPSDAAKAYSNCIDKLTGMVQLLKITPSNIPNGLHTKNPNLSQSYRPNTAFIMMPIDRSNGELVDIYEVYKDT